MEVISLDKKVVLFFEGKTEFTLFTEWLADLINDENIQILSEGSLSSTSKDYYTYCSSKKMESKYHNNIENVLNDLKEIRREYKDENIVGVYVFDNVHLESMKEKGFDYENLLKDNNIIFVSMHKTLDDVIYKFIIDNFPEFTNEEKINKTKTISFIENNRLNRSLQNLLCEIVYSNIKLETEDKSKITDYFIIKKDTK